MPQPPLQPPLTPTPWPLQPPPPPPPPPPPTTTTTTTHHHHHHHHHLNNQCSFDNQADFTFPRSPCLVLGRWDNQFLWFPHLDLPGPVLRWVRKTQIGYMALVGHAGGQIICGFNVRWFWLVQGMSEKGFLLDGNELMQEKHLGIVGWTYCTSSFSRRFQLKIC